MGLGAGPFEEEDDAVDGALDSFILVWERVGWWRRGRPYLRERIVSASSEMSSSNCASLTPSDSISEVKTPLVVNCRCWFVGEEGYLV